MTRKVLLVDFPSSSQEQCVRVLRDCACEPTPADSAAAAFDLLGRRIFEVLLVDIRLATQGGTDLLAAAQRSRPGTRVILMVEGNGHPPPDHLLRLHGYPLLTKPLKIEELARALQAQAEAPTPPPPEPAAAEAGEAPAEFACMVGTSERMKKIYRLVSKVAMQRHPALIMGESGTGKELVARAIHTQGPWSHQPFVPVDCGALPPTLIESELFGHVKGAFTGAVMPRRGKIQKRSFGFD